MYTLGIILTCGHLIFQSVAMVAKKLLVDDKRIACVKQICLLGVICKVSNRKALSGETFCFLEKHLLSVFNFCVSSNYCFLMSC